MLKDTESSTPRQGFFKRLRTRLNRGKGWLGYDLATLAPGGRIDDDVLEDLEALLVSADVGIGTAGRIIDGVRDSLSRKASKDVAALRAGLHDALLAILEPVARPLDIAPQGRDS